ncbi:antitoxin VapB family protein [Candidatus Micrarchaeota archaeon]|nr:antitoxin VapB family protein [Candidatus Micrarchaeota archaeon]
MFINKVVMTRMISVRDEVYEMLSSCKLAGESFSELFLRLAKKSKPSQRDQLLELAGAWKDWDEADEIFQEILKRKGAHRRRVVL